MPTEMWGYAFDSRFSLAEMVASLNEGGNWLWQLRDSTWFGDYLNCRPIGGCRVRIHDAQGTAVAGGRYRATVEVRPHADIPREAFDIAVREVLKRVGGEAVIACEPFD